MKRTARLGIVVLLLSIFSGLAGVLPLSAKSFSYLSRIDPVLAMIPCPSSLQSMVDAAAPGAVVTVPPCIYRETVTINKPLTLNGQPGAEIRGSDVWSSGWRKRGQYWTRGTVPAFDHRDWPCDSGSNGRCQWPEQVFFDGLPLEQVAANPQSGQFAIDGSRRVLLADDPRRHTIEVTMRQYWIISQSDNVTIQGFTMKHAATPAQHGALSNNGHNNWTIQHNTLSDVHGAVVSLLQGSGLKLFNNDIGRGGELGVHGWAASDSLVQGNHIHDNNTEAFSTVWEAGGLKISGSQNVTLDHNEVDYNAGPGLWCDIDCGGVVFTANRVHHNTRAGIMYEISHNGTITGNAVWRNGTGFMDWGWGAGILVSTSSFTEVANNIVAWNTDGIAIISQRRTGAPAVVENYVHDNVVVIDAPGTNGQDGNNVWALGWLEDYPGAMYDAASNNRGADNRFYVPNSENDYWIFGWTDQVTGTIEEFAAKPGGAGSSYLTHTEANQILSSAGIPWAPERQEASVRRDMVGRLLVRPITSPRDPLINVVQRTARAVARS